MTSPRSDSKSKGTDWLISDRGNYSEADVNIIISTSPGGLPEEDIDIKRGDPEGTGLIPYVLKRRDALEQYLERAAANYFLEKQWAAQSTPSEMKKRMQAIETAARKLQQALRLTDNADSDDIPKEILWALRRRAEVAGERRGGFPNHPPAVSETSGHKHTNFQGPAQLRDAMEGIALIKNCASEAKQIFESEIGPGGHVADAAKRAFINAAAEIWTEIFENQIATSVGKPESKHAGKPTGPFLKFLKACMTPIGIEMTDESLRDSVRVMFQGKGKSKKQKT